MTDKTIRIILVDDEDLARQMLKEYLVDFPKVEIIGECSSGKEAVKTINSLQPDLIFLDVQMPELSGFGVLKKLKKIPFVIFSTAYDKYALQAFEVNAVDRNGPYCCASVNVRHLELPFPSRWAASPLLRLLLHLGLRGLFNNLWSSDLILSFGQLLGSA